jgi:SAM-dependent methyltransferase
MCAMRLLRRLAARLSPVLQSDTAFIEAAYVEILGRPADQDGLDHYRRLLADGLGRTAVLLSLMRSDEFRRTLSPADPAGIPSLIAERPDRYRQTVDRSNGQTITVFDVESPADVDWLERAILDNGYYEQPGVWTLGVDTDKRVIAEIIAAFAPARALELGCAAGAALECLADLGVTGVEGVEISRMAIARAPGRVRPRIHEGDVLSLALPPAAYDVVFGLDVFEHLNPNRLDAYLARLAELTAPGGWLFCNVPAFGADEQFGTVFPLYVDGWDADAAAGRPFSALHVDASGYPVHGHLTWADAAWWVRQFEHAGLRREREIERALHRKYDAYFEKRAPARKALFVFSKDGDAGVRAEVLRRIEATPSRALSR